MAKIEPGYTTTVTVTGGRQGNAKSEDGVLDVDLRFPKSNGTPEGTNPEQLFAAAWGGCYQQALIGIANAAGEDASDSTVTVDISQGKDATGGFGLAARIRVNIPGLDKAKTRELADAANKTCPYSKATHGNIDVEIDPL